MELRLTAYPKINLCLYVGKKGRDGYHSLISLFQKTDFYKDDITITYENSDETKITVTGLEDVCPDVRESTVYQAALIWLSEYRKHALINIHVDKHIPVRAGLGGGSSDAGAVLLALEAFNGKPSGLQKLTRIAMKIGSDVPFFVHDCDAAVVSGKGETVLPIEVRNDIDFEIFFDGQEKKSTKEAYGRLDERPFIAPLPSASDLVYEYRENPRYWSFSNDFEVLYEKPAGKCFLSGAGPAWFTVHFR